MNTEQILLYHGSKQIVNYPEIRLSRYTKDFYYGFYCTRLKGQASRWAVRYTNKGIMNEYFYTPNASLKLLNFPSMTEDWLDFIVSCRAGNAHEYDIVEGPMANDTIFNYIQNFIDGQISRAAFWELAKFKNPTHQISFHTVRALSTLTFNKAYEITNEER